MVCGRLSTAGLRVGLADKADLPAQDLRAGSILAEAAIFVLADRVAVHRRRAQALAPLPDSSVDRPDMEPTIGYEPIEQFAVSVHHCAGFRPEWGGR